MMMRVKVSELEPQDKFIYQNKWYRVTRKAGIEVRVYNDTEMKSETLPRYTSVIIHKSSKSNKSSNKRDKFKAWIETDQYADENYPLSVVVTTNGYQGVSMPNISRKELEELSDVINKYLYDTKPDCKDE